MSDVWDGGSGAEGDEEVDLGEAEYEHGMDAAAVFSIDQVLRIGYAVLREQPLLVLLGGLVFFLVQGVLPQIASGVVGAGIAVIEVAFELGAGAELLSSLLSLGVPMLFLPVQMVVVTGIARAAGLWIRNEEVKISVMFTSFGAGLRALLYSLLAAVIYLFSGLLLLGPGLGAFAILLAALDSVTIAIAVGGPLMVLGSIGAVYIYLGLMLGIYAVALDDAGPTEALAISWESAKGARLTLFVTQFVISLLTMFAMCLCVLPVIPVYGLTHAGFAGAWLLRSRATEDVVKWSFVERNLPDVSA